MTEIILSGWCVDRNLMVLNKMLEEAGIKEFVENGTFKGDKFTTDQILSDAAKNRISEYFKAFSVQEEIEKIKMEIRAKRIAILKKVDDVRNGYKRQVDLGITTSITQEKYLAWCQYGQDWCDLPATITQANQIPIYPSEPI